MIEEAKVVKSAKKRPSGLNLRTTKKAWCFGGCVGASSPGAWGRGGGGVMIWLRASFHFQSQERISCFSPKELHMSLKTKWTSGTLFFSFFFLNFFLVWVGMFGNLYKHFPSKGHLVAHVKEAEIDRKP